MHACDQFRWTPLHHACHAGQLDIMKLLVDAGASVNSVTLGGATPLMRAIENSRPCCVDYLLKVGADVTAKNKTGLKLVSIVHHLQMFCFRWLQNSIATDTGSGFGLNLCSDVGLPSIYFLEFRIIFHHCAFYIERKLSSIFNLTCEVKHILKHISEHTLVASSTHAWSCGQP